MATERHAITSREQWLELRKQDVTASVIGALFGAHPYVTARKLYLMHSGLDFTEEENEAMRRGRLMEPTVAAAVAEQRPDWTLEKSEHYYRDPAIRLGATPDYLIHGDPRGLGVLQIKTTEASIYARNWLGGNAIPFYIELQTAVECLLTEAAFGEVAVMVTPSRRLSATILPVPRWPSAELKIMAAVEQFWADVGAGREPDLDYGKDAKLIKLITPRDPVAGIPVDFTGDNETPMLLAQREEIMARLSEYQARKDAIDAELKFKMREGDHSVGLDDWSIKYRTVHYKEKLMPARDTPTLNVTRRKQDV